jgi:3-hydroxyisobutyrate dehydrogenase
MRQDRTGCDTMKTGLIGLGKLGCAVGERLLATQFELACWNRTREAKGTPAELAARQVATLASLVSRSETLILLVRDDEAVLEVCRQLTSLPLDGKLILQMSTVRPRTAREAEALIFPAGGRFVDAPVAGTIGPAREGKLLILAGGATEDIVRAGPVFTALGRRTFHLGPTGAGSLMKLSLNLILTVYNESLGEALALGKAGGLDVEAMLDVLAESAAALPMVTVKRKLFAGTDDTVMVDMQRVRSELLAIEQTARELELPTPAAAATSAMIAAATAAGYGDRDIAALTRYWLEKIALQK